jgi:hypothetical protein
VGILLGNFPPYGLCFIRNYLNRRHRTTEPQLSRQDRDFPSGNACARDLVVEWRDIAALIPHTRTTRTHSEAQVAQIAGQYLIDTEGGIIAGHDRVLAARRLGMPQIPTICLSGLSETQRRAYIIADNKLALNAGWDPELLRSNSAN